MLPIKIPSPNLTKFRYGDTKTPLGDLLYHTLAFSFEYACFKNTPISLNYVHYKKEDNNYIELLMFLRNLSDTEINALKESSQEYHFHEINIHTHYYLKSFLKKVFKNERLTDEIPTIYQIGYVDGSEQPRLCGFFGKYGIFYVLWWDFYHLIYFSPAHNWTNSKFKVDWFCTFIT